jgi:hypothetical protein
VYVENSVYEISTFHDFTTTTTAKQLLQSLKQIEHKGYRQSFCYFHQGYLHIFEVN